MKKAILCLALLVGGCVSPSGLSGSVPNPEDPKYSSPTCIAMRAMASETRFRSSSRTGLALAAEGSHKRIKHVPSAGAYAKHQERGAMIAQGVQAACSS